MDFTKDVFGVVDRYARKVFGSDDELYSIALVLAWWLWSNRKEDFPPSVYARHACRHARYGRDLPGVRDSKTHDAYRLTQWQGGDMDMTADRRPGPDKVAEVREEMEAFLALCSDQERIVAESLMDDFGSTVAHLAQSIGKNQGRVSQIRRTLQERFDG